MCVYVCASLSEERVGDEKGREGEEGRGEERKEESETYIFKYVKRIDFVLNIVTKQTKPQKNTKQFFGSDGYV